MKKQIKIKLGDTSDIFLYLFTLVLGIIFTDIPIWIMLTIQGKKRCKADYEKETGHKRSDKIPQWFKQPQCIYENGHEGHHCWS